MRAPRAVQRFAAAAAGEPREPDVVGQACAAALRMKPEDRPPTAMFTASRHWTVVLIEGLSESVARLVRRRSPPEPSVHALVEEAALGLEAIQHEFDASLRDLDAANWEELSQELDRINDLLRSVVDDVAGRRAPPREPG